MPGLEIARVCADSIANELGLVPGDRITEVNGKPLEDLIAFIFACADEKLSVTVTKKDGGQELLVIDKDQHDELGLVFAEAASDGIRHCNNNCCFCFVDQMPPNLRPSLYVKDDDWRLSVLQGNFITLTNIKPKDMQRLVAEHLGPLYISVHTLNGRLRSQMMGNPTAAAIKGQLTALARAKVEMHCQIVLCPGLNDAAELERTVEGLARLYPAVASVAAVPVGLTKFRNNLLPLKSYNKESALELINWAADKQAAFRRKFDCTFFYLSDEFYGLAEQEVPPASHYDGFPQLENGVGLTRQFLDDLAALPSSMIVSENKQDIMLVTGVAAANTIRQLADWCNCVMGWKAQVTIVQNSFWGPNVTAAGLLTGRDVICALQSASPADHIFLPQAMFSADGLTIDNLSLQEMDQALGARPKIAHLPCQLWPQLAERSERDD
ncbi:MAG: DUF512 domain-containing protein [bacterium]